MFLFRLPNIYKSSTAREEVHYNLVYWTENITIVMRVMFRFWVRVRIRIRVSYVFSPRH